MNEEEVVEISDIDYYQEKIDDKYGEGIFIVTDWYKNERFGRLSLNKKVFKQGEFYVDITFDANCEKYAQPSLRYSGESKDLAECVSKLTKTDFSDDVRVNKDIINEKEMIIGDLEEEIVKLKSEIQGINEMKEFEHNAVSMFAQETILKAIKGEK